MASPGLRGGCGRYRPGAPTWSSARRARLPTSTLPAACEMCLFPSPQKKKDETLSGPLAPKATTLFLPFLTKRRGASAVAILAPLPPFSLGPPPRRPTRMALSKSLVTRPQTPLCLRSVHWWQVSWCQTTYDTSAQPGTGHWAPSLPPVVSCQLTP